MLTRALSNLVCMAFWPRTSSSIPFISRLNVCSNYRDCSSSHCQRNDLVGGSEASSPSSSQSSTMPSIMAPFVTFARIPVSRDGSLKLASLSCRVPFDASGVTAAVVCARDEPSDPGFWLVWAVVDFSHGWFLCYWPCLNGHELRSFSTWSHWACQNVDPKNYQAYVARRPSN